MKSTVFRSIDSLPHFYNILSSVLLGGAITALSYALSTAGLAELAGTFLSFWGVFCFTRLFGKVAATRSSKHFQGSSEFIKTFQAEISVWMKERSVLSIFILGFGAAILYVAFRSVCIAILGIFSNLWFAIAAGLLLSAIIASPVLFRDIGRLVTKSSDKKGVGPATENAQTSSEEPKNS